MTLIEDANALLGFLRCVLRKTLFGKGLVGWGVRPIFALEYVKVLGEIKKY